MSATLGRATRALVALLDIDPEALPVDHEAQRRVLQRLAVEARASHECDARRSGHDHDAATRSRRWAEAIDRAWDLAAHELDVATGRRRAGWAA